MMKIILLFIYLSLSACVILPGKKISRSLPPVVDNTGQAPQMQKQMEDVQTFPLAQPAGLDPIPMPDMQPIGENASGMSSNNTAVLALLDESDIHSQTGDNESASASLERALRIEPRNPALWSKLAAVRLQQGQSYQAEQLALKSNTLSVNNPQLRIDNWQIIVDARKARNDVAGESAAQLKIRNLERRR